MGSPLLSRIAFTTKSVLWLPHFEQRSRAPHSGAHLQLAVALGQGRILLRIDRIANTHSLGPSVRQAFECFAFTSLVRILCQVEPPLGRDILATIPSALGNEYGGAI